MQEGPVHLHWFRRDLRLDDNRALKLSLKSGVRVQGIFIFDRNILDKLDSKQDARVMFIHRTLLDLNRELQGYGSSLRVYYGKALEVWNKITEDYTVRHVFWNRDYEPYAHQRDEAVASLLRQKGIPVTTASDHCILEPGRVLKGDATPYTVFTPFARRWRELVTGYDLLPDPITAEDHRHWASQPVGGADPIIPLEDMGFEPSPIPLPELQIQPDLIRHYAMRRDIPSVQGTSRLGLHLRFGTLSVRALAAKAITLSDTFMNELIWRDFYQSILWHCPHTVDRSFKPAYDHIQWRNHPEEFEQWCSGRTGYPIVDAGMRELQASGWMHNRVRMIAASFLTKHLLIDWRWGEAWFAAHLLDYEQASNVGGWQWAAGCGNDAAPYFRVFNPYEQTRKFDPQGHYIRRWVPEVDELTYPKPVVDHAQARLRALATYKAGLGSVAPSR
jgi:deoxyribodipyrimidine photo-lyase